MALTQSQEVVDFKFREFKKQHFPSLTDGLAFMQFATSLALEEFQLAEADIQSGVMEGKDDGGIDGFHIVVNKTEAVSETTRGLRTSSAPAGVPKQVPFDVIVVQSKSSTDGLDSLAIPKLHEVLDLILSGAPRTRLEAYPLHDKLVTQIEVYRAYRRKLISLDPIRSFTVYVMQPVAETKLTAPAKRGAGALAAMIQGHLGPTTKVRVELLSADGIEALRNASREVQGVLKFSKQPLSETHGRSEAWLGLVTVKDLLDFIRRGTTKVLRDELFTTNVRDFAGSAAAINSAIRSTLSTNSPTAFWWMNNGVTVIVDKAVYQSDNAYLLSNPQIVNGLQTSNVIHEASGDGIITAKRLKESVLIRVISELDPKARESIIQGTNNQAPVTSVQLYANDELQLRIETFLETKGWFYERRRWQFRNQKVPRSKIRSIVELAQVVIAALLLEPDSARARPRDSLVRKSSYERVFDSRTPFTLYSTLLDVQEAVEDYLRSAPAKAISDDPTNDRFFLLTAVSLRLARVVTATDLNAGGLARNLEIPSAALLEELHKRLYALVGTQPDKKARDKIFKGTALRSSLIADILTWNGTSPLPKR
jgi:hypothetical protein